MNCASNSNGNYCRDSIHSKFTLSCIGHVIDGWKYSTEREVTMCSFSFYIYIYIETLASNKFKN